MINLFISNYKIFIPITILKAGFKVNNQNLSTNTNEKQDEEQAKNEKQEYWYLEIPCINLKADIKEGTSKETMDDFIGHFEETKKDIGNIGLAAHNRGYKNNYFEHLKDLQKGDIIYYQYQNIRKEYNVISQFIIKDTDWSVFEETKENILTLITCVENQPEYRRCVQAKEMKNESEEI